MYYLSFSKLIINVILRKLNIIAHIYNLTLVYRFIIYTWVYKYLYVMWTQIEENYKKKYCFEERFFPA